MVEGNFALPYQHAAILKSEEFTGNCKLALPQKTVLHFKPDVLQTYCQQIQRLKTQAPFLHMKTVEGINGT